MVSTSRKKSINKRILFQLDRTESGFPLEEMENI